jgi:hypothetical protein
MRTTHNGHSQRGAAQVSVCDIGKIKREHAIDRFARSNMRDFQRGDSRGWDND